MSTVGETTAEEAPFRELPEDSRRQHLALVIAWSADEPNRSGELSLLPQGRTWLLGRGPGSATDEGERVAFFRQRPGEWTSTLPLSGRALSRQQVRIVSSTGKLGFERLGRGSLRVNGVQRDKAEVQPGDLVVLANSLVLFCTRRAARLDAARSFPRRKVGSFGGPDRFGLVGESPALWALRERAALIARAPGHVLITGASGTGKEQIAQLLHELSPRGRRALLARNAATLPPALIDAELFGNIANYPNPGMPDRGGLIGGADGTSLFLDEVGELGETLQAHLLRVLDSEGQYQRLGSSRIQTSDFRLIAATNRPPDSLKHDLQGRLGLRLETPGLDERREDILPIARELLRRGLSEFSELKERFFENDQPRIGPALVEQLMMRSYTLHVRELDTLLWDALTHSEGDQLEPGPSYEAGAGQTARPELDRAAIEEALARNDGNQSQASRDLGLKNRYALIRLMKKHGL